MELSHSELWGRFLDIIADNLPAAQYNAWFKPITSISFDQDKHLTIEVPSPFFLEQIEARYAGLMRKALNRVYGEGWKLYYQFYQVADSPDTAVTMRDSAPSAAVKPEKGSSSNPFAQQTVPAIDPQLNPCYTFENYCGSDCNKVARSIGEAIADDPRCKTFNPFFLFGPSGVGKTHLMQAIGIRIKEHNPAARVLYVTSRLFESQYTAAAAPRRDKDGNADKSGNRVNDFMHFYQSIDVLIIDDIQDLIGKPKTQNAFFHIFNHLIQNQKQLILSSDCRPAQMEGMEARLLSRFKQGMTAELERPDLELRRSVLRLKAEQDGLQLPDEVIDYIAANVTDSIRELEGVVVSLVAHAAVLNRDITLDLARVVVGNAVKISRRQLNFEMIADAVSEYFDIEPDRIFTKTRKREVSDARQILMYLAKKHTKMPLKAIGMRLDRTHATVLYACTQTEQRLPHDKKLRDDIAAIEHALLS